MQASDVGRTIVSICTYNESSNIERLVESIRSVLPEADVLIVDDNSPDGTGAIADQLAARDSRVTVIHRAGKLGLGSAILEAFRHAIKAGYDFLINMDADFSHSPEYLPKLLAGMRHCDVMIGSRYVAGGGTVDWDWKRKTMSRAINWYSRILLRLRANDTSGSFRCYRLAKVQRIDFRRVYSTGYSFMEEFLYHCQRAGCKLGETPIIFANRKHGKSKINWKEAVRALWSILYVAIRG